MGTAWAAWCRAVRCFTASKICMHWIHLVENLVCLGSPHHGAVLERFGFHLQEKLGRFPIVKIVGHLVNIRSNGILDLRLWQCAR